MATHQQTYAYHQLWSCPFFVRRLLIAAALSAIAGCGLPGDPLPTGVMPTIAADQTDVWPAGQLNPVDAPACAQIDEPMSDTHRAMYEELNRYRIENGLEPLLYSKTLETAAQEHVTDLWERGFFSHTNPDGEDPGDRAVRAGFCHKYVGENIAAGQWSTARALQAWIDSPPHKANLLEARYVYVGMGHSVDSHGRQYWGQVFAYDLP